MTPRLPWPTHSDVYVQLCRCAAEARHVGSSSTVLPAPLSQLLLDTYTACQAEAEQLEAAVEAEDEAAIAALQGQLQGMQQQVEAGIRAAKPPANVRRWLQVGGGGMCSSVVHCVLVHSC